MLPPHYVPFFWEFCEHSKQIILFWVCFSHLILFGIIVLPPAFLLVPKTEPVSRAKVRVFRNKGEWLASPRWCFGAKRYKFLEFVNILLFMVLFKKHVVNTKITISGEAEHGMIYACYDKLFPTTDKALQCASSVQHAYADHVAIGRHSPISSNLFVVWQICKPRINCIFTPLIAFRRAWFLLTCVEWLIFLF